MIPRVDRIRDLVDEHLDRFAAAGIVRLPRPVLVLFPCAVFMELCALPMEQLDLFLGWSYTIIRPQVRHPELAADPQALAAVRRTTGQAIYDYFDALVEERRTDPATTCSRASRARSTASACPRPTG